MEYNPDLRWYRRLHWQVLMAMLLGIGLGYSPAGGFFAEYFGWLGDLFMRLLRMIIVPLVVTSIISGVASAGGGAHGGPDVRQDAVLLHGVELPGRPHRADAVQHHQSGPGIPGYRHRGGAGPRDPRVARRPDPRHRSHQLLRVRFGGRHAGHHLLLHRLRRGPDHLAGGSPHQGHRDGRRALQGDDVAHVWHHQAATDRRLRPDGHAGRRDGPQIVRQPLSVRRNPGAPVSQSTFSSRCPFCCTSGGACLRGST